MTARSRPAGEPRLPYPLSAQPGQAVKLGRGGLAHGCFAIVGEAVKDVSDVAVL